mmetsp:Transcript_12803/g.26139  ORF Transcript_12803/g.26139 Transcript_12803/m.26139 type:complete len:215 (+) Transcript_12803:480-1124(+)
MESLKTGFDIRTGGAEIRERANSLVEKSSSVDTNAKTSEEQIDVKKQSPTRRNDSSSDEPNEGFLNSRKEASKDGQECGAKRESETDGGQRTTMKDSKPNNRQKFKSPGASKNKKLSMPAFPDKISSGPWNVYASQALPVMYPRSCFLCGKLNLSSRRETFDLHLQMHRDKILKKLRLRNRVEYTFMQNVHDQMRVRGVVEALCETTALMSENN